MYFLFYAVAFDDAIRFENLKFFWGELKNIFPSLTSADI